MLNQPVSSAFGDAPERMIEVCSAGRFRLLLGLVIVLMGMIFARVAWLQTQLQDDYLAVLDVTTTEYEIIPARDGRILSDTQVLAADEDLYTIEVHYRWLQDPPDDAWIRARLREMLTREERSRDDFVSEARNELLRQRHAMWSHLLCVSGLDRDELHRRRLKIQQDVIRIADEVNRRREDRLRLAEETTATSDADPDSLQESAPQESPLMRIASAIRSALTTPPHRSNGDRTIVREEETYHPLVRNVSLAGAAEVRSHPERFPGVRVTVANRRTYPRGTTASHVVGARTALRDEEVSRLDQSTRRALVDWRPARGRNGVERSYDHRLSGTPGLRRVIRNRRQEIVSSEIARLPVAGRDVILTLHAGLQQHAEELLEEALMDRPRSHLLLDDDNATPQPVPSGGSVVVMDVRNGRILAAASAPGFDLSLFTSGTAEEWDAVNQDRRQPFLSRVEGMSLPPGSVIKPLTAIAAMESGYLHPDTPFYCQGYLRNPDEHRCLIYRLHGSGHEDTTLHRALAESCNVYFFEAARRTGIRQLTDWTGRFGLGALTGIDLPFEKPGTIPAQPGQLTTVSARKHFERETLGLAIGQSRLTATPLQIARMMAAIANGGWLVVPHVVSSDGIARTTDEPDDSLRDLARRQIPGLRSDTLEAVREGLDAVVNQPYGTGYETVRLHEVRIAGKSGTAETRSSEPDHAWFAGYVPSEEPRYAFVVVLEHGGSGSRAAGPVARELVRYLQREQML